MVALQSLVDDRECRFHCACPEKMPDPPGVERKGDVSRGGVEQRGRKDLVSKFSGMDCLVDRKLGRAYAGGSRSADDVAQRLIGTAPELDVEQSFPQRSLAGKPADRILDRARRFAGPTERRQQLGQLFVAVRPGGRPFQRGAKFGGTELTVSSRRFCGCQPHQDRTVARGQRACLLEQLDGREACFHRDLGAALSDLHIGRRKPRRLSE